MSSIDRQLATVVLVLAGFFLAGARVVEQARKQRPAPCPPSRYLPTGGSLLLPGIEAVQIGSVVGLDGLCAPVAPKQLKANRKGVTQVRATWKRCPGLAGKVTLTGTIVDGCARFKGTVKAKRYKQRFDALLSTCGDGVLDEGAGEECDDGNETAADGC